MLYLDNAATSYRKPAEVYLAMAKNSIEYSMNAGRGGHRLSIKGEEALLDSAEKLCGLFAYCVHYERYLRAKYGN